MSAYDREQPFVPTVQDPGPVSFSADGQNWTITRDRFWITPEGLLQGWFTEWQPAGAVLEPALRRLSR